MSISPITAASVLTSAAPVAVSATRGVVNQFGKLLQQLTGDSLPLSSQKKEDDNLSAQKTGGFNSDALLSVLQKQTNQMQQQIDKEIRNALNKNGIPVDQTIDFHLDSFGRIQVVGEHPQKEAIEKSLATRPELSDQMARLSGLTNLLQAAKEGQPTTLNSSNQPPEFQFRLTASRSEIVSL